MYGNVTDLIVHEGFLGGAAVGEVTGALANQTMHQFVPPHSHKSIENHGHSSKKPKQSGKGTFIPEEVVEKIIARLPFPSVFKTLLLSKAWNEKLIQPSERGLTMLQKEISSVSTEWTTYSPVFYTVEEIWGYDRVSSQWKSMFTLSQLPILPSHSSGLDLLTCFPNFVGSVVLVELDMQLFVTNVITRSWKELLDAHSLSLNQIFHGCVTILLPGYSGDFSSYRVLLIDSSRPPMRYMSYDSNLNEWSPVTQCENIGDNYYAYCEPNVVYLRGKLYLLMGTSGGMGFNSWKLCVHNVDSDKSWMGTPDLCLPRHNAYSCQILRCGEKIMMPVWQKSKDKGREIKDLKENLYRINVVQIYELDLNTLQLVKICRGPPKVMWDYYQGKRPPVDFASDENFIYFGQCDTTRWRDLMMTYNVHSREWGFLPHPCFDQDLSNSSGEPRARMSGSAFAPGQNPFVTI